MKTRRSRKALSPVVASIILIAVTVAVSIAVAAWMGALTFNFMGSSSISITNVTFNDGTPYNITLAVKNTGTKQVTISQIKVNNVVMGTLSGNTTLDSGLSGTVSFDYTWVNGNPYKIDLYDAGGGGVGSTQQNAPGS